MESRDTGQGLPDGWHRPQGRIEAVDAAEAAAGAAGKAATALLETGHPLRGDLEPHFDAPSHRLGIDVIDLGSLPDDALGKRKAASEILEVARRRHHHCVTDAVVDQRHGDLLGHRFLQRLAAASRQAAGRPAHRAFRAHAAVSSIRR